MSMMVGSLVIIGILANGPDTRGPQAPGHEKPAVHTTAVSEAAAIRQRVKEGQKVRVTDDQGQQSQGRIGELTPDTLVLLTSDRQRRGIPYRAIVSIDRPHDGLGNGAAIGFLSGGLFGVLAMSALSAGDICDPGFFRCEPAPPVEIGIPFVLGGLGAGIGVVIDAIITKEANLFRRTSDRITLAPMVGGGVRGVRVSMQW